MGSRACQRTTDPLNEMTTLPPSITLDSAPHPALSYAGLRAEALELLGRLCGAQWSDFNTHDPGITILEQLCFALTELAYRSQWPMEDLLASAGADWQPAAAEILSGDPVTRDDLLALLRALGCQGMVVDGLDQPDLPLYFRPSTTASVLAGRGEGDSAPPVAGDLELEANLETSRASGPPQPVAPRGIWRVAAQLGGHGSALVPASLLSIAQHLHGTRLLGRDFTLEVLVPFEVVVQADLELVSPAVAPGLMERLSACLDAVITEVGATGAACGLRTAALIQALDTLPEVRRVISLGLAGSPAGPFHAWHLSLPGRGARLHPASPIRLVHRGLPLEPPPASPPPALPVAVSTSRLATAAEALELAVAPAPAARSGRRRTLSSPRSLARQLPAVYGVGPAGLPADATPEQRARALQLRAYLLFFDQLLANGEGQLAFASQLLAPVDPSDPNPLDAEAVRLASDRELPLTDLSDLFHGTPAQWQEDLRQALRASAPPGVARQRADLLAHLLRCFGEELDLEVPLRGGDQAAPFTEQTLITSLVVARSEFLRRIVPLTGGRGSGPDLLASDASQGPFAERLCRKLGLALSPDGTPPLLVIEHLLLRPLADDSGQRVQGGEDPIPFLSDVARPDPWSGRVSVVIDAARLPAMADVDRDRWLVRLLRQELPAHLQAELHLLADDPATPGEGPWSAMLNAWCRFRALLQAHRLAGLGAADTDPADPIQPLLRSLRLRDSRDCLLSLLRIGLPWPLRSIPLPEQVMVASGQTGAIELPYSQKGVRYQLVDIASGALVGEGAEGTDGPLTLATPLINDDLTLRVLASVLPTRTPDPGVSVSGVALTASGRARSTLLTGAIRMVEGIDVGLSLSLLDLCPNPLPLLHPEGTALVIDHGQRLYVLILASQEGVVYEVIDDAQRSLPHSRQKPLSAPVTGTSRPIFLELFDAATEDRDLAVRASLEKRRGRARAEDRRVLTMVLPLRVRANPAVPLRLLTPVVDAEAQATVAIGDAPGKEAVVSQASVSYQLRVRPLADADWLFDNPAAAPELIATGHKQQGLESQPTSTPGNGAALTLEQTIRGEGMVVAALARKEHRLTSFRVDDPRTHATEVPLCQAAVALARPDAKRRLLLRREMEGRCVWSFWGGQPGVVYTLMAAGAKGAQTPIADPVPIPEAQGAVGGQRGIGRVRVARDLVVAGDDGPMRAAFDPDPSQVKKLLVWARFLRSGIEVALERPPILVAVEPPAVSAGESACVAVSRLDPAQQGRLLRADTLLREGTADAEGRLLLDTGPLAGATQLLLDVGVSCPVRIAQGVTTDLDVRVVDFQPLQAGAPAHLLAWGASAEVELANSQDNVTYTLINAADREKPPPQQRDLSRPLRGTGGPLRLRSDALQEDVDLLVRGIRLLDASGLQQTTGYLSTVLPLRVRANPAVSLSLVEPVIDPASDGLVWVGDDAIPSQANVTYVPWSLPLKPEDWQWRDGSATAPTSQSPSAFQGALDMDFTGIVSSDSNSMTSTLTSSQANSSLPLNSQDGQIKDGFVTAPMPQLPSPLPDTAWLIKNGWRDLAGKVAQSGSDGDATRGSTGRLRLSLGPVGSEAFFMVVARKQHNPFPLGSQDKNTVIAFSWQPLATMVLQCTRPDPGRRLALVADARGWRLVGGEPGCFYTVLRRSDDKPLGQPVYVHQRTTEAPPNDWGIGRLRIGFDLAVASAAGPALDSGLALPDPWAAVVIARRVFSGTTSRLRQAPLLVTQESPPAGSKDTATLVVKGLAPGERVRLLAPAGQPPAVAVAGDPARIGSGALPENTELTLEICHQNGTPLWSFPVKLLAKGATVP